jgi:tousled-like kinase
VPSLTEAPSTPVKSAGDSDESRLEYWKTRCQDLERECTDKEEQLKAVSNTRTILHTALKTALEDREKELSKLREDSTEAQQQAQAVLEKLVRSNAEREAHEQRERLATDGARLGRIVYTRAGMRSVETWEEGHASKQIAETKANLVKNYKQMQKRQEDAKKAAKRIAQEEKENGSSLSSSSQSDGQNAQEIGGIVIKTKLDAMEAVESARFHIANLRLEEKELALEEKRLNAEKAAHIRSLKRVASEDHSRFRSRPKVCYPLSCDLPWATNLTTHLTHIVALSS